MSEENVEAIRAVYERFSKGDFRASLDVVDPLVLFVQRPEFPESGAYLGIARLVEYTRGFLEPWSHITIEANSKVIRLENFRTEAEALEAAGLRE